MAQNETIIQEHPAEFKAAPFGRPAWTVGHWQASDTEPCEMNAVADDLIANGWRELSEFDRRNAFPQGTSGGIPVHRAFVHSDGGSRFGHVVTLTDKQAMRQS
jgi:hypothetical protein